MRQHIMRRKFLERTLLYAGVCAGVCAGALVSPKITRAADESFVNDDGLHQQPWFLDSFLDLSDDLAQAHDYKKRFAVIWELKGCPYCKEVHKKNFSQEHIRDYIRTNFDVLQLNLIGGRYVTDLDGEEMMEKDLAKKYGIRYTPTIQFFRKNDESLATLSPKAREVSRIQGYMQPDLFLRMFKYVREEAYEQMKFRQYVKGLS